MKTLPILVLFYSFILSNCFSQTTLTPPTVSWTAPAGVTCVLVEAWGGGGGGADNIGSGGGGGGYSSAYFTVIPGNVYPLNIGLGGGIGDAGGNTWFIDNTTLLAIGGNAGGPGTSGATVGGGTGGTLGIGSIVFSGGNGGNGDTEGDESPGGGGSSAGSTSNGTNGTNGDGDADIPGLGGIAPVGGGNGGTAIGFDGNNPGGGGGGGGISENGGSGGNGQIVITIAGQVCPTSSAVSPTTAQNNCLGTPASQLTAISVTTGAGCPGATIQYQWYSTTLNSNIVTGATLLVGETNSSYTPSSASTGTSYYFCVVYDLTCSQTNAAQSLASNVVEVTINTLPTTSTTGSDQTICLGDAVSLTGNTPAIGTGTWSITSGPNNSTGQFSTISDPLSTFTPTGGPGSYVLNWTISNSNCPVSVSSLAVTVNCDGVCPPCVLPVYTHPTIGINNEKVGACVVNDCGPFTYADNGNLGANYSDDLPTIGYNPQNAPYRVFCPSIAGNCMQATFNSFSTSSSADMLWVRNGPTEYSPMFTSAPTTATGLGALYTHALSGTLPTPFTFTSTDSSGCLTFNFLSDGSDNSTGWDATLSCVPCAMGPNGIDNNDCIRATPLCSTTTFSDNSTGPGLVSEGCDGINCPAGGENHSSWYTFTIATSGTFTFLITPLNSTDDYDFNIQGPASSCGTMGSAVRCSDSELTGPTGLTMGAGDTSEDVTGDKFVQFMDVVAGETYYLTVDKWSASIGSGFNLSFGGTATLDCSVILPIELSDFSVQYAPDLDIVDITWVTESEFNCDYYTVEKSIDGIHFDVIRTIKGNGTTQSQTQYFTVDPDPFVGVNYYRLNQFDFNGSYEYSEIRAVNILDDYYNMLSVFPNPATGKTEVIFNSYSKGEAQIKLFSPNGDIVLDSQVSVLKGGNIAKLDLSNIQKGVYIISIVTNHKVYTSKIIKQ